MRKIYQTLICTIVFSITCVPLINPNYLPLVKRFGAPEYMLQEGEKILLISRTCLGMPNCVG